MERIEITKTYLVGTLGLQPEAVKVIASDGAMTLEGKCNRGRCPNSRKIVDIDENGRVEVLTCSGRKDDCLG